MDIEWVRSLCLSFPGAAEEIKWDHDLCFVVAGKLFCVANLEGPLHVSFKVSNEEFPGLSVSDGFIPAPYLARACWVQIQDLSRVKKEDLAIKIRQSYELIKAKLSKKTRSELGIG